jgi:uncharacterized protein (TIGR02118 family)
VKSIAFMPRRADVSRTMFRTYYEHKHAPLALRWFRFDKYVRNHLIDSTGDPGFDCYSEFWSDDTSQSAEIMSTPVADILHEDERNFADQPRIRSAIAEERIVHGPPRGLDADGTPRTLLMFERRGGEDATLVQWLSGIACHRAALDLLSPIPGTDYGAAPWQAAGSLWEPTALLADWPAGWHLTHHLNVESFEFTPAQMRAMHEAA